MQSSLQLTKAELEDMVSAVMASNRLGMTKFHITNKGVPVEWDGAEVVCDGIKIAVKQTPTSGLNEMREKFFSAATP